MREHKENCLKINCKQSVRLKSGSIKFQNHFKEIAVLFKIYADFECNLKKIHSDDKNKKNDDRFSKSIVLCRGKNAFKKLWEQFLNNVITANK